MVENLFKKNPLQNLLSSLNAVISTNESTEFITGHVIYNPAYTYKYQLKITYIVPSSPSASHALWIKRFTVQKVLRWIRVAKLDRKRLDYVWYCAKLTWLSDVVTHIRLPSSCGLVVAPIQKDTDSKGSVRIKKKSNYKTDTETSSDFWQKQRDMM